MAIGGQANRLVAAGLLAMASTLLVGGTGLESNRDSRLLAAHNRERSAAGIAPLAWNPKLAADAAVWADYLSELNDLEHSPADEYDSDAQGENLWLGTHASFSPEQMVGGWIEEKRYFRQGVFPNNSRTGNLDDIGHYTQLMWRDTDQVGCAVASNAENDVLVCRYAAAGNVIGERPF